VDLDAAALMGRRRGISPVHVILLAILAVVILFWVRAGRPKKGAEEAAADASRPAFVPASVETIEIERPGGTVRLKREKGEFWFETPYRDRVDPELIAQSLQVAAKLEPLRTLPDSASKRFGLAPPNVIWRCMWPGGTFEVALGDSLPGGGGRYARRTGSSTVIVIDGFLARRFLAPSVQSLHDPSAAVLPVGPLDSVLVKTRDEKISIVRRRNDLWEIVSPIRADGSAMDISRAVQALRSPELTAFLGSRSDFDLGALGLDPPRAAWTLVQGNVRQTVLIGHATPDQRSVRVVPGGRDVVALIDSENFRTWVDGLTWLRDSRIFAEAADSIVSVMVEGPGGSRSFARVPMGGWTEIAGRDSIPVRQDVMLLSLNNLCAARATGFEARWPGDRDAVRIHLRFARAWRDSATVAPLIGESAVVRSTLHGEPCLVDRSLYDTWSHWLTRPLRPKATLPETANPESAIPENAIPRSATPEKNTSP
jgi:hypothetical protein